MKPDKKEQEKLSLKAFITLKRSAESISSRVHSILSDYDLTESQFGILEAIQHIGPLCQKDLAAKILKTTANITLTIDKLEKKGLVRRERNLEDRRYYAVHLTEEGQRLISEVFPRVKQRIVENMTTLSESELSEFSRMCKLLGLTG